MHVTVCFVNTHRWDSPWQWTIMIGISSKNNLFWSAANFKMIVFNERGNAWNKNNPSKFDDLFIIFYLIYNTLPMDVKSKHFFWKQSTEKKIQHSAFSGTPGIKAYELVQNLQETKSKHMFIVASISLFKPL